MLHNEMGASKGQEFAFASSKGLDLKRTNLVDGMSKFRQIKAAAPHVSEENNSNI
jgi:hypothetical protein